MVRDKVLQMKVTGDLYKKITQRAAKESRSVSQFLSMVLEEWNTAIEQIEREDEQRRNEQAAA